MRGTPKFFFYLTLTKTLQLLGLHQGKFYPKTEGVLAIEDQDLRNTELCKTVGSEMVNKCRSCHKKAESLYHSELSSAGSGRLGKDNQLAKIVPSAIGYGLMVDRIIK